MVVAGVLALGLVTIILRQHAATDGEGLWQGTSEPAASDAGPAAGPDASAIAELSAARSGSVEPENTAAADLRLPENAKVALPRDHMAAGYRSETWNAILEDPPKLTRRGDPEVDAETAYRLYLYLRWCGSVATTERQAEVQFQQFAEEIAGATDEEHLRGLKWGASRDFQLYEFCRVIPPGIDRRYEAVKWLAEAVRLEHEVAQIEYYDSIIRMLMAYRPAFVSSSLVLLHPELPGEFRDTSRVALARAMERGHPEAFLAMSQAVIDGVVFPRDPVLAYAYAHLAELEAGPDPAILGKIGQQKFMVSQYVEPGQIAEAEQLALKMRLDRDD